jgi:hypothetical protein
VRKQTIFDLLFYQGFFYDKKNNNQNKFLNFYNASLKATADQYLVVSNENLGNIEFLKMRSTLLPRNIMTVH